MIFAHAIDRAIRKTVTQFVKEKLPEIVAEQAPRIIKEHLSRRFDLEPTLELTRTGFSWAFIIYLQRLWPDVPNDTAVLWMDDYLDVPVGAAGHEWTPRAAKELAENYVNEFGDAP